MFLRIAILFYGLHICSLRYLLLRTIQSQVYCKNLALYYRIIYGQINLPKTEIKLVTILRSKV